MRSLKAVVEVFDITGELKNKVSLQNKITTISCDQCGNGIMIVRVFDTNGIELCKPQKVILLKE